jgi:hypothetical protein
MGNWQKVFPMTNSQLPLLVSITVETATWYKEKVLISSRERLPTHSWNNS